MRTFLQFALLVAVALPSFGCSHNYYNIPRETFEKKVRVLGVAPIFVDAESDIRHPEKEALVSCIKENNRKNEKELVARIKETGSFFAVRLLDNDPDELFSTLFFRRERRDDAGVVYNKYFYKLPELKDLLAKNGLDAVMVTVVSGLTRKDSIYSSNLLSYLESDYNYLIMTSQILDADGNILWEFPNFRMHAPSLPALLALQYPDFDEAKANANDKVDVKFKTIAGIYRAFNETENSSRLNNARISTIYANIFGDMTSLLQPEMKPFWEREKEENRVEQPKPAVIKSDTAKPAVAQPAAIKPATSQPAEIEQEVPVEEIPIQDSTLKEVPIPAGK